MELFLAILTGVAILYAATWALVKWQILGWGTNLHEGLWDDLKDDEDNDRGRMQMFFWTISPLLLLIWVWSGGCELLGPVLFGGKKTTPIQAENEDEHYESITGQVM